MDEQYKERVLASLMPALASEREAGRQEGRSEAVNSVANNLLRRSIQADSDGIVDLENFDKFSAALEWIKLAYPDDLKGFLVSKATSDKERSK